MYTIHLILQGHLGNMDLLIFPSFLFSSNWSIQNQLTDEGWGSQGSSSLKTHARYDKFFPFLKRNFTDGRLSLLIF